MSFPLNIHEDLVNIYDPRLLRCHSISVPACTHRHLHTLMIRQGGCVTPTDDSEAMAHVVAAISRWEKKEEKEEKEKKEKKEKKGLRTSEGSRPRPLWSPSALSRSSGRHLACWPPHFQLNLLPVQKGANRSRRPTPLH